MSTTIMEEPTPDKKHKRSKSEHKKKRSREDQETTIAEETPRKSKKSKSQDPEEQVEASEKKKKKQKHRDEEQNGDEAEPPAATEASEAKASRKRSSKRERKEVEETEEAAPDDRMDVDEPEAAAAESPKKRKEKKSKKEHKKKSEENAEPAHDSQSAEAAATEFPSDPEFPFFTQTISLYVPFFPVGFDKPLTSVAAQHLEPLLNHYSPLLRGVLLSYSNLNLSDRPVKASAVNPPTDETPARLHSVDEYAVGFGWLTFDAHLFVPSRGKWMEGVVQLQSEGHIGVVCWNKFNASIEAKRLPGGWQWVDIAKSGKHASPQSEDQEEDREQQVEDSDALDGEELQVVEQMHTTGYWVNENGRKVGGKLRFRIKNFDVGQAGDYGYLSLEGTCLGDDEERTLAAEEREAERRRRSKQNPGGLLKPMSRRVPEFSMTKFGKDDEEEDDGKRAVLYKASRPGTPDD
ncbi:DNA-directed RNA polymerase I subunit RPA43 [Cladorrhinum samala]|uniref:DNA-directed RNA polymerase subunit n=1 Tax=Cladorrhinum samala TaxID=585594 RepID=A0AAV9HBT3_9PEZI|nr:DNA-directed RNA polymerase I subunit RPA43 [Cladorrhinum samala]